jgi:hypothetical protein
MGPLDLLIIFVGIGLVVFLAYQKMARALFALGVLWAATMLSGLLYEEAAFRVKAVAGPNTSLTEGIMFVVLLVIFFAVGYILMVLSFPETRLPKIGFLDGLMGLLLGVIVAGIMVTLLHNAIGVMVSERWSDASAWSSMRNDFMTSPLRLFTRGLLSLYRWLFVPFFRTLPPALTPL